MWSRKWISAALVRQAAAGATTNLESAKQSKEKGYDKRAIDKKCQPGSKANIHTHGASGDVRAIGRGLYALDGASDRSA